jgi:hypothetical protein
LLLEDGVYLPPNSWSFHETNSRRHANNPSLSNRKYGEI